MILESSPIAIHLAFIGLSIDLCSSRFAGFFISNKPSFRQEHLGVSDGPDGSDGTS
jgi:hypothetical protein